MQNKYKLGILALVVAVILAIIGLGSMTGANASEGDEPCTETIVVVDEEAWTETIEHPAVTEVVHHDAVTETTPAIWANWAPNDTRGPQDYAPNWPVDNPGGQPRGVWIIHDNFPPGHEGPDGVYQQGAGNSPWFYRQAERVTVISEAYDETVVVEEAWTETIEHAEVSHEETVEVDCPDEEEPPVDECLDAVTGEDLCVHEEPEIGTPAQEEAPNPDIQQPGPGETITFQSFDGQGNLVEQRVSKPIPADAQQEGM